MKYMAGESVNDRWSVEVVSVNDVCLKIYLSTVL